MQSVKEVIVVEGRYDKNALCQVVDAIVIETAGFGIFNDRQKAEAAAQYGRGERLDRPDRS